MVKNGERPEQRILLIDDDPLFCRAVERQLRRQGFEVSSIQDPSRALTTVTALQPRLLLLDYSLGGPPSDANGLEICKELHRKTGVPIIMLTGETNNFIAVSCLEAGADDYITKPYDSKELAARIRAVLRRDDRTGAARDAAADESTPRKQRTLWHCGDLQLDTTRSLLSSMHGQFQLGHSEAVVLLALLKATPEPADRDQLCRLVFRRGWTFGDRTVDMLISRLRKKVNSISADVDIVTQRGLGYALRSRKADAATAGLGRGQHASDSGESSRRLT